MLEVAARVAAARAAATEAAATEAEERAVATAAEATAAAMVVAAPEPHRADKAVSMVAVVGLEVAREGVGWAVAMEGVAKVGAATEAEERAVETAAEAKVVVGRACQTPRTLCVRRCSGGFSGAPPTIQPTQGPPVSFLSQIRTPTRVSRHGANTAVWISTANNSKAGDGQASHISELLRR